MIAEYGLRMTDIIKNDIDAVSVDEAAVYLGQVPTVAWRNKGETNIIIQQTQGVTRVTLLLG